LRSTICRDSEAETQCMQEYVKALEFGVPFL
jgi:hypothetical protein